MPVREYSDVRGHAPVVSLTDLPNAVGGVRTITAGRWKLGAPITLPNGERLVIADGASLSGEEHTEHVILGNVDGAALITFEGNGGAGEGRAPQFFGVVNNSPTGDGIHFVGTDSSQSFVSFKMYARGGRYGFCASGTCNAIVSSDALFEGDTAGAYIEAAAQFLRIRDVRLDGASAAEVVCDGSSITQAEFLRCAVVPTTNGIVLTEANGGALGTMIVSDVSGVTAPNPLVGISESESRYTGRDNTALSNSPESSGSGIEALAYTLSDLLTNLNVTGGVTVPLLGAVDFGSIAGLTVVGNTLVVAEDMVLEANASIYCARTGNLQRGTPALQWQVNGVGRGPAGQAYIRGSSNANEGTPSVSALLNLNAGDVITLRSFATGATSTTMFVQMDDAFPSMLQIKRLS